MQSYKVYGIDFSTLANWLLPKTFRKIRIITLLRGLMNPINYVHTLFINFRKAKIYQLSITSQVVYLQKMLNDRYDSILRRIRIVDAVWHLPVFVYLEAENKPVHLYTEAENKPVPLYTEGEAGVALNDFVVLVPADVLFDMNEMRSLIDSYKLFGTRYTIQIV